MNLTIKKKNEYWTSIIQPRSKWFDIRLPDIWKYRDLLFLFVRRDFVSVYKQTILGPIWFIFQPLFSTIVFTIVFGKIARIPTDRLPQALFYMSGIVTWNYFAACLTKNSDTFVSNKGLFGKVYFPKLVVPISVVITNLLTFAIQFLLFLAFTLFYYFKGSVINPNKWIMLIPFLLIEMAALGLGIGILVSSLTTKYRDFTFIVGFGIQLWMYATPIVYPISQVPEKWHWIYSLNPMSAIVGTFRYAFLGAGTLPSWQLGLSLVITSIILFAGIVLFSRIEKTFIDTV